MYRYTVCPLDNESTVTHTMLRPSYFNQLYCFLSLRAPLSNLILTLLMKWVKPTTLSFPHYDYWLKEYKKQPQFSHGPICIYNSQLLGCCCCVVVIITQAKLLFFKIWCLNRWNISVLLGFVPVSLFNISFVWKKALFPAHFLFVFLFVMASIPNHLRRMFCCWWLLV